MSYTELDSCLKDMKEDILKAAPLINENVHATLYEISDAIVLRYHQTLDMLKISQNLKEILGNSTTPQVTELLVEGATAMISAMHLTREMKEIVRWQRRKQVMNIDGKVLGMETHYQIKILEQQSKHSSSKDTVILLCYKTLIHLLQEKPEFHFTSTQLKEASLNMCYGFRRK